MSSDREHAVVDAVQTGLLIGGRWRSATGGETLDVEDPATGKVLTSVANASPEDGVAALDAAVAAQVALPPRGW
jgi:succinate-semialdehyde dehydrogenase/glutarate-semialdehyde dehydrogenase